MPFGDFAPLRPGERLTAAELNRMADAVEALGQSSSAYGSQIGIDRTGGGIQPVDGTTPGHWAKITGSAAGLHSHVQQTPDGVDCPATTDYFFGTTSADGTPAREVNGRTAPTGEIVWLEMDPYRRGWVFVYQPGDFVNADVVTGVACVSGSLVVTLTTVRVGRPPA